MSAGNEWPVARVHKARSQERGAKILTTVILQPEQAPLYSRGPSCSALPPLTLELGLPSLL